MNTTFLLQLIDKLLAEGKGKGKGRNLNRVGVLGFVALTWWNTRSTPAQFSAINHRMAVVEKRLGIESVKITPSTNDFPNVFGPFNEIN